MLKGLDSKRESITSPFPGSLSPFLGSGYGFFLYVESPDVNSHTDLTSVDSCESKVGSTLDLTRISPSILLRRSLVSNPSSNRRSTPVTSPAFGIPLIAVKVTTSGMANSHSVMASVYKARERIHRCMVDR
ncbi:hypothetical protein KY290_001118 [Solanum tuberosum]|uniref:Uncharacterized protein n=1 Tax=Solanum tuberosum TaxID=4113 RepID=A0ABQ7WLU6_SOLTU|nr:hypothetical protein KY290_001118 [Solanum tuberosum]